MHRTKALCAALVLLYGAVGSAEQISLRYGELTLLANRVGAEDAGPLFLILHGTWAHYDMEIIRSLQEGLAERGYRSVAPNLSLGLSARKGFRDCDGNYRMRHEDAAAELAAWIEHLKAEGEGDIVLVGHSRGGAQAALYLQNADPVVRGAVLLAPMVFDTQVQLDEFSRVNGVEAAAALRAAADDDVLGPLQFLSCADARVPAATLRSYYGGKPEKHTPLLLTGVDVPVQVFLGSADEIARWSARDVEVASALPHVSVHQIEDAGHFFRDLFAEDVMDLMVTGR